MWARITRGAVAVAIVVGVTSCESGVFDHPGGDTGTDRTTTAPTTGTGSGGNTTTGSKTGDRYGWFLPEGPDSPSFPEDDVHRWSVSRACAQAQSTLEVDPRTRTAPTTTTPQTTTTTRTMTTTTTA
ncbi:hypothetical protein ACQPYE_20030 [Actinosynnema sp. CA-299493]